MLLGIALANQKKAADAKKAFTAAGAANPKSKDVAALWSSVG
jgi:cytochrome c-type biogenesis protein CcmH/NrfG